MTAAGGSPVVTTWFSRTAFAHGTGSNLGRTTSRLPCASVVHTVCNALVCASDNIWMVTPDRNAARTGAPSLLWWRSTASIDADSAG